MTFQCESGAYRGLVDLIENRYGIVVPRDREPAVRQSLKTTCHVVGVGSLNDLYGLVAQNCAQVVDRVLGDVTVNYTSFLREATTYDAVIEHVIPTLRGRSTKRVWCAACSSGEELYTLAMVLANELGLNALEDSWTFLGTDINSEVLRRAEDATYSPHCIEPLSSSMRRSYFEHLSPNAYRVHPRIQSLCTFRRLNLFSCPFPFRQSFDIIFCRNVLYYFSETRQTELLNALYRVTHPGGWLVTSASEAIQHLQIKWQRRKSVLHFKASP